MSRQTSPASAAPSASPRPARFGLAIVSSLAVLIAAISIGVYAGSSLDRLAAESRVSIAHPYVLAPPVVQIAFYVHVVAASLALLLGPFQFIRRLRDRHRSAHRVTGRVYLGAVWAAAVAALVIAPFNSAGTIGTWGFAILAVLWATSGLMAYRAARRGRFDAHRAWMLRNYALTFAAVTLRLWLPVLMAGYGAVTGADADTAFLWAYHIVPFLCWVPNLLVAEWLIRRRGLPSLLP